MSELDELKTGLKQPQPERPQDCEDEKHIQVITNKRQSVYNIACIPVPKYWIRNKMNHSPWIFLHIMLIME